MSHYQPENTSYHATAADHKRHLLSGKELQSFATRSLWLLSAILCMLLTFMHQAHATTVADLSSPTRQLEISSGQTEGSEYIQRQQLEVDDSGTGTLWLKDHQQLVAASTSQ